MKNDIEKVDKITNEMQVNDLLYNLISIEYEGILNNCNDIVDNIDYLYFAKRVMSVFENIDMPFRAAVGLLNNANIIATLYKDKCKYIGESDSDTDIRNYVIEHGYRHYDEIRMTQGRCCLCGYRLNKSKKPVKWIF